MGEQIKRPRKEGVGIRPITPKPTFNINNKIYILYDGAVVRKVFSTRAFAEKYMSANMEYEIQGYHIGEYEFSDNK